MAPVAKPDSNTAASAEKMSDAKATEAKGKGKASQAYEPKDGTPQEGPAPEKPTKADVSPAKLGLLFSSKYATAEPVLDIMERRKHPSQPHSRRGKRNLPGGNETGPSKDSESKKSPKTQKSLDSKDAKEQKQELGKQREPKKQDPENKPAELDLKPTKWSDMIDDDDYESEAELIKIANSLWKNGDGRSTSESSPNSKTSSKTKDTASTTKPPTESINATEAEEGAASTPDAVLKSKDETVAEGASTTAPAKPFGLMGSKWSTDHIPNARSHSDHRQSQEHNATHRSRKGKGKAAEAKESQPHNGGKRKPGGRSRGQ